MSLPPLKILHEFFFDIPSELLRNLLSNIGNLGTVFFNHALWKCPDEKDASDYSSTHPKYRSADDIYPWGYLTYILPKPQMPTPRKLLP